VAGRGSACWVSGASVTADVALIFADTGSTSGGSGGAGASTADGVVLAAVAAVAAASVVEAAPVGPAASAGAPASVIVASASGGGGRAGRGPGSFWPALDELIAGLSSRASEPAPSLGTAPVTVAERGNVKPRGACQWDLREKP
jgi:hypothetical protein